MQIYGQVELAILQYWRIDEGQQSSWEKESSRETPTTPPEIFTGSSQVKKRGGGAGKSPRKAKYFKKGQDE